MPRDVYLWHDVGAVVEALAIERAAYRAADLERRQLLDEKEDWMRRLTDSHAEAERAQNELSRLHPYHRRRI
jgi:hypothetical protein